MIIQNTSWRFLLSGTVGVLIILITLFVSDVHSSNIAIKIYMLVWILIRMLIVWLLIISLVKNMKSFLSFAIRVKLLLKILAVFVSFFTNIKKTSFSEWRFNIDFWLFLFINLVWLEEFLHVFKPGLRFLNWFWVWLSYFCNLSIFSELQIQLLFRIHIGLDL